MRCLLPILIAASFLAFAGPTTARADTTTSGIVVDDGTGARVTWGYVALITRGTLNASTQGQQVWFNLVVQLDSQGRFAFTLNENDPAYSEFYLYTISPLHFNEIHGGKQSTFAFPLRSDFNGANVVPLSAATNNSAAFSISSSKTTRRVLMRDGVTELATDVYQGSPTAKLPTILARTPYNKDGMWGSAWYCLWGYNIVAQDSRGRFASDGTDAIFRADGWGVHQDGYDTIDWIVNQPFANDKVGMMGGSAGAITQYLAAGALHPSLKCCYAIVGSGHSYQDMFFTGGIFRKSMIEGWLAGQGSSFFLDELKQHPNQDAWWDTVDITARAPQIDVPFLHFGGWWDIFQAGCTRGFRQLEQGGAPQKMIMGPWTHGTLYQQAQGELVFPANASLRDINFDDDGRFFEYWLKGIDNGYYDSPAVRYYTMGDVDDPTAPGNDWQYADQWPPESVDRSYWLTPDGRLTSTVPTSGPRTISYPGSVTYSFDPLNPVPTRGGANLNLPSGPFDQRPIEARNDVIEFTTPPLTEPIEITGDIRARLMVSCDQPDTDYMVKLCDVYPDGRSMLITEGALHARHHLGHDQENLLTPGKLYWMNVDMWGTSVVFNTGHRIRISITSSNDPAWEVNPNTGEPFRQHTHTRVATSRIHCAPGFWSHVILPVVGN